MLLQYRVYAKNAYDGKFFLQPKAYFLKRDKKGPGKKMKKHLKAKHWTDEEIKKLFLARQMGASIAIMAKLLDRSVPSVNKALTRLGVRPLGSSTRGVKPGSHMRRVTFACVKEYVDAEMIHFRSEKPTFLGKKEKPCMAFLSEKEEQNTPRKINPNLPILVSLDKVIHFWQQHGVSACPVSQNTQTYFRFGKELLSPAQLLVLTNRKRETLKQPLFWVSGLTEL